MYVPEGRPAATVIVPLAFNVNPVGTVTPVKVTCPGFIPITAGDPSKVSLVITDVVLSPAVIAVGVSFTAFITFVTLTVTVAVSQFTGFAPFSHIL